MATQPIHSLRRFDAVVECYDRFLEVYSECDPVAWYNKGLAEEALGRNQDAVRSFQNAITFAPNNAEAYVEQARQKIYLLLNDDTTTGFH
jgi:tetratricopeptide (TPR) repeat protein